MIRIAVLDDREEEAKRLELIIHTYFADKKTDYETKIFVKGDLLLMDLEEKKYFDIFFLDMEMPDQSGLDMARQIRDYYMEPFIVYVTNHTEYAPAAFEVNAFRYIPKIMLEEKLPEALDALLPQIALLDKRSYMAVTTEGIEKILLRNIFYITKEGKYIRIFHRNGESRVRKSLQDIMQELNSQEFFYIDKGCIVNIAHILSSKKGEVLMRNHRTLPISRPRYHEVRDRIMEYWKENS